jgi:hypothetical protein
MITLVRKVLTIGLLTALTVGPIIAMFHSMRHTTENLHKIILENQSHSTKVYSIDTDKSIVSQMN